LFRPKAWPALKSTSNKWPTTRTVDSALNKAEAKGNALVVAKKVNAGQDQTKTVRFYTLFTSFYIL